MSRKILTKIIFFTLLGIAILAGAQFAMAQDGMKNEIETAPAELFQPLVPTSGTSKISLIQNLPKGDWPDIVASVIKLALGITGSLAFASFTFGGVLLVTAQGDETKFKKGKSVIFWSLLALVIIAVSYSIVLGITNLKFFNT